MQTTTSLEQQNMELRFALSRLSHEIRNPLSLISSELQLMASKNPALEELEYYDSIRENLDYMADLLEELSVYNNARKLSLTPVSPSDYLGRVAESIRPTLDYLGIILETHISENLPIIPLDRIKIRQALLNLFRNAQQAISHEDGKITFTASAIPRGIRITVSDNGCGMSPEEKQDIFLPFITHKEDGTGLGLAITKQIIDAHGGNIQVESTPGAGTTFYIFLG